MSEIKRKISYLPAFLSVSFVIFLMGLLFLFLLEANKFKKAIKEDVRLSIYFRDEANDSLIQALKKELSGRPYVLDVHYISKEEGLKIISSNVGEHPDSLLGFNPIPKTLEVRFKEHFVATDSLEMLKKKYQSVRNVREVSYDTMVMKQIERNITRIGITMLGIVILLGLISIALINNTIRLMMYSKRFIIKSMQFVGATRGFIMRPFMMTGLSIGLAGGIFACILFLIVLRLIGAYFTIGQITSNYIEIGAICLLILLLSIIICMFSSYLAINRYLRLKLDDLF